MHAVIFALLSYIGWGIGDVVGMLGARKVGSFGATYWIYVLRLIVYLVAAPFFFYQLRGAGWMDIVSALLLGVANNIGSVAMYKAATIANPGVVSAVVGSWGAIAVLLSVCVLGESISVFQTWAIILICFGLGLMTFEGIQLRSLLGSTQKGIGWACLTALSWGIVGAFIKFPTQQLGWFWATLFLTIPFTVFGTLYQSIHKTWQLRPISKNWLLFGSAALLAAIGDSAYNIGVGRGLTSVIAPIAGSYATLSVVVAAIFFREAVTRQQKVGILFSLVGIVVLSFISV